ncbi:MAG: 3-phosphoshikimate 1-carboxyvinyltransferase [Capnocytophaga sp.]|nr:3-phosphoshikimate 1-carboxyvinyltransferase [Capnocytophaga sp.]
MSKTLPLSRLISGTSLQLSGSKSETNRLLLLQALYPSLSIENASDSDDSKAMIQALLKGNGTIDIHHAGTAMRFLTAYFASKENSKIVLTGSQRMKERPIGILVDALRQLGADISYTENEGCPPLSIKGKTLTGNAASLPANVSSQYISALMLIAPTLPNGLTLQLLGELTSVPYIEMTAQLLRSVGIQVSFENQMSRIEPKSSVGNQSITVESDWSSVSYWYSFVSLSEIGTTMRLSSFKKSSLQGDSVLQEIYQSLGVETRFDGDTLILTKISEAAPHLDCDLRNAPDIAQTIAVSCFGLGTSCHLTGLHTLKIKETDRLEALKNELSKFGADICVSDKDLSISRNGKMLSGVSVATYNDHRMAMAFAPLMLKTSFSVLNPEVVTKSYPHFWKDAEKATRIL